MDNTTGITFNIFTEEDKKMFEEIQREKELVLLYSNIKIIPNPRWMNQREYNPHDYRDKYLNEIRSNK